MPKLSIVKLRMEKEVNAYLLSSDGEAIVIDAGLPVEKIIEQVGDLRVRFVVATHGHAGHVAGKDGLSELTKAETAMSVLDAKFFLRSAQRYLNDGDELEFGGLALRVIHTPGHTPGSLCFLVGNHLFTGDTLLPGGIGKELPGSDIRQQMFSIGTKLLRLRLPTAIYAGHGAATSLENELRTNPFLRRA